MMSTAARSLTARGGGALAWLVGTAVPLLALAALARSLGDTFCGAPGRLPDGVDVYSGPTWTGPARLTCDYGGRGRSTFTAYGPLVAVAVAGLLWLGWTLLVWRTARRLAAAKVPAQADGS